MPCNTLLQHVSNLRIHVNLARTNHPFVWLLARSAMACIIEDIIGLFFAALEEIKHSTCKSVIGLMAWYIKVSTLKWHRSAKTCCRSFNSVTTLTLSSVHLNNKLRHLNTDYHAGETIPLVPPCRDQLQDVKCWGCALQSRKCREFWELDVWIRPWWHRVKKGWLCEKTEIVVKRRSKHLVAGLGEAVDIVAMFMI